MRKIFTLLFILSGYFVTAQTICGTANENGSVTLTTPPNTVIVSVDFASYGTPNGTCGSFTIGSCHAASSLAIAQATFVGQNSATLAANNSVFGDPCNGTVKRLYIQATYSSAMPLTLVSFTAQRSADQTIRLDWKTEDEANTSHFDVEYSTNGSDFTHAGRVDAKGTGSHFYHYDAPLIAGDATIYYRLKMIDLDGKFTYSSIARIMQDEEEITLSVFPNPASQTITIASNKNQLVMLMNSYGQVIEKLYLAQGSTVVDIASLSSGLYFVKAGNTTLKFIRK